MKCPNCGNENATRLSYYGNGVINCKYCPVRYEPKPLFSRFVRAVLGVDSIGRRTAAHDADMSRRRLAEDGRTVIRDYGKKII